MLKTFIKKIVYRCYQMAKAMDQNEAYDGFRMKYDIHKSFRFNGNDILFYGDGQISCGENTYIGAYSTILAYKDCKVLIGKYCSISHNVRMYTQSNIADQDFSILPLKEKTGNVIIEDYVWIGANVFINPGVTIGRNSIVGSNSVVTKDVKPNAIVGGVPAKLIRFKS